MRIALAGAGAFGEKHLDGLKNIDGVEIASVISRRAEQAAEVAARYGATILSQIGVSKQKARPIPTVPSSMPTPIESKSTPEEQKNVDAYKAMMAAMESKKEADFLGAIADDAQYDDYTLPQTMKGKAEAKKFFKEMTTAFPDAKMNILHSWALGDERP